MKELSEYFSIFIRSKRVLIFSGVLFLGIFYSYVLSISSPESWKVSPEGVFMILPVMCIPIFTFFALTGTHRIEALSKSTFWYLLLIIFTGVMLFFIPAILIALTVVNVLEIIPYAIFSILCAIAVQIPVAIRFRKYFFKRVNYVPTPTTIAFLFSLVLSLAVLSPIVTFGFWKDGGWSYFQRNFFCAFFTLFLILLSYIWTLNVVKNDGKKGLWEKWLQNV